MDLPVLWFLIIGVLFAGYFVLEGFDFGVGMLMPILGRHEDPEHADKRQRVVINTIGPFWDGNEVWLITAGGALFAAFPEWYATLFEGFYLPLFLILLALIVRAIGLEFRGKIDSDTWRRRCDAAIIVGSFLPALLWGVAFANIVAGVEIGVDKSVETGLLGLLNPYALLGGLTFVLVFLFHGAVFVALKTGGEVREDAVALTRGLAVPTVPVAAGFLIWTQLSHGVGWTWIVLGVAAVALLIGVGAAWVGREGWAFTFTTLAILGTSVQLFGSLFPFVMPSSLRTEWGLTIDGRIVDGVQTVAASSSPYTLTVMTWVAAFCVPVVLGYQAWSFWVFRRRITVEQIPASIGLTPRYRAGAGATGPAVVAPQHASGRVADGPDPGPGAHRRAES